MLIALKVQNTDTQTESDIKALTLGRDLRGLRKSRGLTLSELALKVGRSVSFLSQVERGISSPSIEDLRSLTKALDVPISWFFMANETRHDAETGFIVRAKHRRALGTKEGGIVEELLSPDLGGSFEMFRTVIEPGAELAQSVKRDTEESGIIISGTLDLWIEDAFFHLEAGDSFRFDHKAYRWRNPSKDPTLIIWVVSPPVY